MSFRSTVKLEKGFEEIRRQIAASISPFGLSTPAQRRDRKRRALADPRVFAETYFPHYCTAPFSKMHRELFDDLKGLIEGSEATGEGGHEAVAAPRGNAKSTICTLVFPLWCVAGSRRRFIGILSDTTDQANEFLEFIKAELEVNDRLAEDFPEICGEGRPWKVGHIVTRNGVKLRAWGAGKRIRGARHGAARPDLVIGDDLEDDEHVESPEQRRKRESWFFKAVMKMGSKKTVTFIVGTILHYDALLARLLHRPGWTGKKFKSVIRWSSSPLWAEWEGAYRDRGARAADRFFRDHRREMLEGTEVLWPEVEDYRYLMRMRLSDGPAFFDSEKQNEPINPEDCLFQEDWFDLVEEEEVQQRLAHREYTAIYAGVDPSMGRTSKSDPSAIVVGGVQPDGRVQVLEADIARRPPDAIMERLFELHGFYRFHQVTIEEVQFQEFFKDTVIREGARRGVYLPVTGTRPVKDKILRISKLQPHIKNGLIRFRRNQRTLLDQLKYFPKADHDDGPDALEILFSRIQHGIGGPRIRRVA